MYILYTGCALYLEYEVRLSQKINFLKNGQTNYNVILTHNRLMYKIAIYSIKSPFASITASMRPWNLEQALVIWAFFMALNSFLVRLINSSFTLHGILLVHLSIAPHTKSPSDLSPASLEAKHEVRQNQQSCCSAKVALFSMYGRAPSPVATHMAFHQSPYVSRAVCASPKPSDTPPC